MSGGHYDYAFGRINDFAMCVDSDVLAAGDDLEPELIEHMRVIAGMAVSLSRAAHDLEWLMSGDYSLDTLKKCESWKLSEEARHKEEADDASLGWLEMAFKTWPKKQPGNGGAVPPSSPKAKLRERWNHWVKAKKVDPRVLYLACWKYQNDYVTNGHYIKALINFLSPSAKMVPEYLPWAKEEYERQANK